MSNFIASKIKGQMFKGKGKAEVPNKTTSAAKVSPKDEAPGPAASKAPKAKSKGFPPSKKKAIAKEPQLPMPGKGKPIPRKGAAPADPKHPGDPRQAPPDMRGMPMPLAGMLPAGQQLGFAKRRKK